MLQKGLKLQVLAHTESISVDRPVISPQILDSDRDPNLPSSGYSLRRHLLFVTNKLGERILREYLQALLRLTLDRRAEHLPAIYAGVSLLILIIETLVHHWRRLKNRGSSCEHLLADVSASFLTDMDNGVKSVDMLLRIYRVCFAEYSSLFFCRPMSSFISLEGSTEAEASVLACSPSIFARMIEDISGRELLEELHQRFVGNEGNLGGEVESIEQKVEESASA